MNPGINQVAPLTKKEFWEIYWFSPFQMVTLINPKSTDYKFMVESRHFIIRAGAKEQMPGTVANVYLSQMTRILAQDNDNMEMLSDINLMRQYYDQLIVDKKELMPEDNSQPSYLKQVPEHMKAAAPEAPPWQQATQSTIPQTNSDMSNEWTPAPPADNAHVADGAEKFPEPAKEAKESVKEFELEGSKFKMVIDKNDNETFFRDGKRVSAADYQKAASML